MVEQGTEKARFVKFTNGEYQLVEEDIPQPQAGKLLIRVAYSTVNPIDGYLIYTREEGHILGGEGSGTVLAVGEGVSADLVGKKVAFVISAWASHAICDQYSVIVLDDSQDLAKAASSNINPLTAFGQLYYAKKLNTKAVIQTAGSSSLAKQFYKLGQQEGVEVISIVRKDDQIQILKDELG